MGDFQFWYFDWLLDITILFYDLSIDIYYIVTYIMLYLVIDFLN